MLRRAGPDEVEFEIRCVLLVLLPDARGRKVPAVDVVVAEVVYTGDCGVEGLEDLEGFGCEGCAFGN